MYTFCCVGACLHRGSIQRDHRWDLGTVNFGDWRLSLLLLPATLVALTREASEASAIDHELRSKNKRCHCCTTTTFVEGTGEQATRRASACDAHTPHDGNHQQQTSSTFPLFFFAALEAFSSCFFFLSSLASCFADPFPAFFFAMLCVGALRAGVRGHTLGRMVTLPCIFCITNPP